jgi:hypothetical protein
MKTRDIRLRDGTNMQIDLTEQFEAAVRKQFSLPDGVEIEDSYIKMYFYGALKNALDKAEKKQ